MVNNQLKLCLTEWLCLPEGKGKTSKTALLASSHMESLASRMAVLNTGGAENEAACYCNCMGKDCLESQNH